MLKTSCKKATYLVAKKEANQLSWLEKIKLRGHLAICSMCRKFELQSGFISRMAKHTHIDATLPAEIKERMDTLMKNS